MKRANLVLHDDLLEEATRLSGEKTYSRTVNRALEELVRRSLAKKTPRSPGSSEGERENNAGEYHPKETDL
jgi:Arc/MetJ family transcription regulator